MDVAEALRSSGTEVLVSYLPVGSQRATEFYAEQALRAGCAFVNCIPVFIASNRDWARRFEERGLRPTRVHGCNSLSTMIRMTIAGLGLSVLPIDMMRDEIAQGKLTVVSSRGRIPPNRFLVAHQSDSFDATMTLISDLAVALARESGIFRL